MRIVTSEGIRELGRLVPPFPRQTCQAVDCGHRSLNETDGAYLHQNLNAEGSGLTVLCGPCHVAAELHAREWLPVVAL